jgi:hypothetical protein
MTTYQSMARDLGLGYCRGINERGQYCHLEHRLNGSVADDVVHFADRPVTRADTFAFLKLAAQVIDPTLRDEAVPWRRVYRMNRLVRDLAHRLHVRLPAHSSRMDRAFVLAGVAGLSNEVPLRKQAFDWARRGPSTQRGGQP